MKTTRREFMRQVGVSLAALLLSGCDWISRLVSPTPTPGPARTPKPSTPTPYPYPTCYVAPAPTFFEPRGNERWYALRACWLDLRDPRLQLSENADLVASLRRRHVEALDALVTNQEMRADVADEIGVAFEQALAHIERKVAVSGEAIPREPTPRRILTRQAMALAEMTQSNPIAKRTIDRAQAALERDMAWLSQFRSGLQSCPSEDLVVTPAEVEAARILVQLLLAEV